MRPRKGKNMNELLNIYCDESCHLEHDHQTVMVLGAVVCPESRKSEIVQRIKEIKQKHGFSKFREMKWTSVSAAKLDFYMEIVDYFFSDNDLRFRAVIADKTRLDHDHYGQSHDQWYYKMYYYLINFLISPTDQYKVYLDIKDTRSAEKLAKLHECVCNSNLDFDSDIIKGMQHIHSKESQILQLCDLLIGAIAYANRGLNDSPAKVTLIDHIKKRSGYDLIRSTLIKEPKFNLFRWKGKDTNI